MSWSDPLWQQLYPPIAADLQATGQSAPADPPVHYLDVLQQAAASGQAINLSDMPGYQTNLSSGHEAP